uniref:DUF4806 domain-containing protein n=1 Tax=Phlebotomus papatasi TaxID=29031 RepID=A0A1B0DM80_PHLPP
MSKRPREEYGNLPIKFIGQPAKPGRSKILSGPDNGSGIRNKKGTENCCCDHIQYIYRQMKKHAMENELHKEIINQLPLQTKEDLEEFDKSLLEKKNKKEFKSIASNLTLKQILNDDVVMKMKFNGKDSCKGIKDYIFYNIWKEASPSHNFAEIVKAQMRAAKSRVYTAKYKQKKSEAKASNIDVSDSD